MQCPPDFAAVGVFVMMAAVIGRKVSIRPKRKDDWTVVPNLWGAVIGNSGVMKSSTLSTALSPIAKLAAEAFETYSKAKVEHEAQAEVAKLQQLAKRKQAIASLKENPNGLLMEADEIIGLLKQPDAWWTGSRQIVLPDSC